MWEPLIEQLAELIRKQQKEMEENIRLFVQKIKETDQELWDKWECIAQAMLALRAHEESRMRLWKVIQYAWNWESIYDKK